MSDLNFHCKARAGKEKFTVNTNNNSYVHIVEYNRQDKKRMVGMLFYNMHDIIRDRKYVKYAVSDKRIYFEFTNIKDIHAFKLTFNGSHTVDDLDAINSSKYPRKIQTDTDADLLAFCGHDFPLWYDATKKLCYIENKQNNQKLF